MNIDKFGHHPFKKQKIEYHCEQPIIITESGCLDARNKPIKNIGKVSDPTDCATKQYVDKSIDNVLNKLKDITQTLTQQCSDLNSLKQNVESIAQKVKKK